MATCETRSPSEGGAWLVAPAKPGCHAIWIKFGANLQPLPIENDHQTFVKTVQLDKKEGFRNFINFGSPSSSAVIRSIWLTVLTRQTALDPEGRPDRTP